MLTYAQHLPANPRDGAPVLLLLHGRGSDKDDLIALAAGLPDDTIVIAPRAPFAGSQWGYGGGFAWYRFLGGVTPEAVSFERSMDELGTFVSTLPDMLPVKPGPVVVGGFSQGGTTALGFALLNRARIDGVMMFSGFLPSHPAIQAALPAATGLRVFWGHGTADPMIPINRGHEGRTALRDAGAEVVSRDYPIGHWIDQGELSDASAWLTTVARSVETAR